MPCSPLELIDKVLSASGDEISIYAEDAAALTRQHFGNRRTLFNPLYVSNVCVNDCSYCGYRRSNRNAQRRTLTPAEAAAEARALYKRGVRHILILAGEYAIKPYFEMLLRNVRAIRETSAARWLGVEVASLDQDHYAQLAADGVNCIAMFQETYDRRAYRSLHSCGDPKADFDNRYDSLFRAVRAGIREVGLGVLYGVGDWYSDTLAMAEHAQLLLRENTSLKLRFAFPRLMESDFQSRGARSQTVTEDILFRIMVAVRLAFPHSSLVLTGRESSRYLRDCLAVVNVVGKGGSTVVGGYEAHQDGNGLEQFSLNTDQSLEEFRRAGMNHGFFFN
jgi:2-iminoacetate synthase